MSVEEQLFADVVEMVQCMIVLLRADRTIAYFNAYASELTGRGAREVQGEDFFALFVPAAERAEVEGHFRRVLAGDPRVDIEVQLSTSRGSTRWVTCSLERFNHAQGEAAVLLTAQDVTVHKHTEATLQRRTHDLGERIKELNCLFGLTRLVEELGTDLDRILQGLVEILPPAWQYPEATCARVVFENRQFTTDNFRQTRWRQAARIAVYGRPAGQIEVCYLEEKPEEHEGPFLAEERRLLDALAEQLGRVAERRKLEKEISEISTREQRRIGQELHDGLGQELTGLGYLAETLYCDLQESGAPEAETANRLAAGIEHALDQARSIAKGLVPVEIEAQGLVSALRQLASATQQRRGVACRFCCNEPVPVGDTATATQIFRIVQEAINNAAKHARARRITVELKTDDCRTVFEVRDDGVGMPDDPEPTSGMGLRIMRYRAGVIGATLSIRPADSGGTLVSCALPRSNCHDRDDAE